MREQVRISFLGGGNMAVALLGGMLERGFAADGIQVVELSAPAREKLQARFAVRAVEQADDALLACDLLVLAVKPQQMRDALRPLAGRLAQDTVVVSIAAGLRVDDLARWLGGFRRIVRAMPNTPALVGAGLTGLFADASVNDEGRALAERVLAAVGTTLWVSEEAQMDAVTAISGSGPGYVFRFIEALEAAALARGFEPATARTLAVDTVFGAASLARSSSEPPARLREQVTSKGGTTAAALDSLAGAGFFEALLEAVSAAEARGRTLGAELGKD